MINNVRLNTHALSIIFSRKSTTAAPPLCPQHCGPFTAAAQVALDQSIYRLLAPLSLSLSIFADDEAYALHHGDASSTSPSTSLRPKLTNWTSTTYNTRYQKATNFNQFPAS